MSKLHLHQNKTWAECAIGHWLNMEPSEESAEFLSQIMREHAKETFTPGPRRLRSGMVQLRRVASKDKRRSRIRAAEFRRYYADGNIWPIAKDGGAA